MNNTSFSIDAYNAQLLDEELAKQEPKVPVTDFRGETIDAAGQTVYCLEGASATDYFCESDAVEYLDWLKQQYSDELDMIADFGFNVHDLFRAIEDGEFSENGQMDLLLFLGAEKVEANN